MGSRRCGWLSSAWLYGWYVGCLAVIVLAGSVLTGTAGVVGVEVPGPAGSPAGSGEAAGSDVAAEIGEAAGSDVAAEIGEAGGVSGSGVPSVGFVSDSVSVLEGGSVLLTVGLDGSVASPVVVDYAASGGSATAGADFAVSSGSLTFEPGGARTQTVMARALQDGSAESNEVFRVVLSLPLGAVGYVLGSFDSVMVTVVDDDGGPSALPVVTVERLGSTTVMEGAEASFAVRIDRAPLSAVRVGYFTADGFAMAGLDYVAQSGSVLFLPGGVTSQEVVVAGLEDYLDEFNESFSLNLAAPDAGAGYTLGSNSSAQRWIDDNDAAPWVRVTRSSAEVAEGGSGSFTFRLSPVSGRRVVVLYSVSGTAVAGTDFEALPGWVSIPAGTQSVSVPLTTLVDYVAEESQAVTVTVTPGSYYTPASPGSATIAITDSLSVAPVVSVAGVGLVDSQVEEGAAVRFRVSLDRAPASTVRVAYATADGTAVAGLDYVAQSGSLSFAPSGALTQDVVVTGLGDLLDELAEDFRLSLTVPDTDLGYVLGLANSAQVWIADDDPAPSVSVARSAAKVAEGSSGSFVFRLSAVSGNEVTVGYSVGGSATVDSDFAALPGSVTIPAGTQSASVPLLALADAVAEGSQAVTVTALAAPSVTGIPAAYVLGTSHSATIDIIDRPVATISPVAPLVFEGGRVSFTITLDRAPASSISVSYESLSGTAKVGLDYGLLPGVAQFTPDGPRSHTVWLSIKQDTAVEGDEMLSVRLREPVASAGYVLGETSSSMVTIADDDQPVAEISPASVSVSEGSQVSFMITLDRAPASSVQVRYGSLSSTAVVVADYELLSGSVTFTPSGTRSRTVTLRTVEDLADEPDEMLSVQLREPLAGAGYTRGVARSAAVTIRNDDAPIASITPAAATVIEGAEVSFTVRLDRVPAAPVSVRYGTASGTARAGLDYAVLNASVRFTPDGELTRKVTLRTVQNNAVEPSETLSVRLLSSANRTYRLGTPSSVAVTIIDDDTPVAMITPASAAVTEGGSVSLTVSLDRVPQSPVSVGYATFNGTARAGFDYTGLSAAVTFAPGGPRSQTVMLRTTRDNVADDNETLSVRLRAPAADAGYVLGSSRSVAVTIVGDGTPVATLSRRYGLDMNEGRRRRFTVSLTKPAAQAVVVPVSVDAALSEVAASDYTLQDAARLALPSPASVTIPAGQTSAVFYLFADDDLLDEPAELAVLRLGDGAGYVVSSSEAEATARVSIRDNDHPPAVTLAAKTAEIAEGETGVFAVALSAASGFPVTVRYARDSASSTAGTGDYSAFAPATQVTIPAGQTTAEFSFAAADSRTIEPDEILAVRLTACTHCTLGSPRAASITIIDRDTPTATIIAGATAVVEGGSGSFTVVLDPVPRTPVMVAYSVAGKATPGAAGVAGADYAVLSGVVGFAAYQAAATVVVATWRDAVYDNLESIRLILTDPVAAAGYRLGASKTASVWIWDAGSAPTVTVTAGPDAAAGRSAVFAVALSAVSAGATEVRYAVAAGAGLLVAGTPGSGSVTIPAGRTVGLLSLPTSAGAAGSVAVTLVAGGLFGGYALGEPAAASVLVAAGSGAVSPGHQSNVLVAGVELVGSGVLVEGSRGSFKVGAPEYPAGDLLVGFAVSAAAGRCVAAPGSAGAGVDVCAGKDYRLWLGGSVLAGDSVVLPASGPGSRPSVTVTVEALADGVWDGRQQVVFKLQDGVGYVAGAERTVRFVVFDDGGPPLAAVAAPQAAVVTEGNTGTFTVRLSRRSQFATQVGYTVGGSAVAGADYAKLAGQVVVAAGALEAGITVVSLSDGISEPAEDVTVRLAQPPGPVGLQAAASYVVPYALGGSGREAGLHIADRGSDAIVASISAGSGSVAEGSSVMFSVSLSRPAPAGGPLVVRYRVEGSATAGADYGVLPGELAVASGERSGTVTLAARSDMVHDLAETVRLTLAAPAGAAYVVGRPGWAQVEILNVGAVPVAAIAAGQQAVPEGSRGTFTVSLRQAAAGPDALGGLVVAGEDTPVRVVVDAAGSTAGSSDYSLAGIPVVIRRGSSSATVTLTAGVDAVADGSETVALRLWQPASLVEADSAPFYVPDSRAAHNSASVTIADVPTAAISVNKIEVTEGDDSAVFAVAVTPAPAAALKVSYRVSGAAAPGAAADAARDYTALAGSVAVTAGTSQVTVALNTHNDSADEPDYEDVTVTLQAGSGYNLLAGRATAAVLIADNDRPAVTLQGFEVTQGTQSWNSSVQLIRGRPTAVRAFLTTPAGASRPSLAAATLAAHSVARNGTLTPLAGAAGLLNTQTAAPAGASATAVAHPGGIVHDCLADHATRPTACRADIDSSLNYLLPDTWTSQTTLQLTLTLPASIGTLACPATPGSCQTLSNSTHTYTQTITLNPITPPTIAVIAAPVKPATNSDQTYPAPTLAELQTQMQRALSLLPLPPPCTTPGQTNCTTIEYNHATYDANGDFDADESDFQTHGLTADHIEGFESFLPPGALPNSAAVARHVQSVRASIENPDEAAGYVPQAVYVAVTKCPRTDSKCRSVLTGASAGDLSQWGAATWNLSYGTEDYYRRSTTRNIGAHELGHALGEPHTFTPGQGSGLDQNFCSESHNISSETHGTLAVWPADASYSLAADAASGWARLGAIDDEEFYHKNGVTINTGAGFAGRFPLLGPLTAVGEPASTAAAAEVWGLDLYALQARYDRADTVYSTAQDEGLVVSNPRYVFEVMSYCNSTDQSPVQSKWLSQTTHQRIYTRLSSQ